MSNIQIGSLVLNAELLIYLAAGAAAAFAMKLYRRGDEKKDKDVAVVWNAVLIWIAVWKGSLLLFDFPYVVKQPMALLYFSGGVPGMWLAAAVAALYVWHRYGKRYGLLQIARMLSVSFTAWLVVYCLAMLILGSTQSYGYMLGLFAAAALQLLLHNPYRLRERLFPALQENKEISGRGWRAAAQGLGIVLILLLTSYMLHDQLQYGVLSGDRGASAQAEDGVAIGAKEGLRAPDFQLTGLNGEAIRLSDYRGQTVLLTFWTTWCSVCKTEMPHLVKLQDEYRESGADVAVLSVNVTAQEAAGAERVKQYAAERGLNFAVALDEQGSVRGDYRVSSYPTALLIDGEGIVRERLLGAVSYQEMKKRIERVRGL